MDARAGDREPTRRRQPHRAAVGYAGLRLSAEAATLVNVQAALAIVAGSLLVVQGLISAGVLRRPSSFTLVPAAGGTAAIAATHAAGVGCLAGGMLGSFLRTGRPGHVFLAGMLTGFLPCGLVYAYLALAASTSDMLAGAATMAAFGAGTIPVMMLTGSGASLLSLAGRQRMLRMAAWCVVLVGAISLARGFGFWTCPAAKVPPAAQCAPRHPRPRRRPLGRSELALTNTRTRNQPGPTIVSPRQPAS